MKNREKLGELLEGFIDGTLDAAELQELKGLLTSDPAFRRDLVTALHLRGLGYAMGAKAPLEQHVATAIDELSPSEHEEKILRAVHSFTPPRAPRWRWWALGAVAAQLLLGAWLWFPISAAREQAVAIARVESQSGSTFLVRGQNKMLITPGLAINRGDELFVEDRSEVVLTYPDTSQLTIFERSYAQLFEKNGGKRIQLLAGFVRLNAAPQPPGHPIELWTEHSHNVVRGTELELHSSSVSTLLEVKHGRVEVLSAGAKAVSIDAQHFALTSLGEGCKVYEIGKPLAATPLLTKSTPGYQMHLSARIAGARKLYLVVTNGGDNNRFDHVIWMAPTLSGPVGTLDLTSIPWKMAKSGWGRTVCNSGFFGEVPRVNGQPVPRGLVTHATSVIEYDLPEGYEQFDSDVGLLDSGVKQKSSCPSVTFELYTALPNEKLSKLLIHRELY